MERGLTTDQVEQFVKELGADPSHRLLQNALTHNHVDDVALDHQLARSIDASMSHQLDDWKATNQKQSGRCWMFAGLNLLRVGTAERLGVKDFEFSQTYPLFWDKLEKANHWLESVITLADRDGDDRTLAHLLASPAEDGGQWNMFLALVAKHGLVPQSVMPETVSSSATRQLNRDLSRVLRRAARDLRAAAADGADAGRLRELKQDAVTVVHRMLSLHLGTPPTSFDWQWRDKDKQFHRDGEITPQEFAERYVTVPVQDYVCLVHDPRPASPVGRTFTVEHLGNVVDGPPVVYLNVGMDVLRRLAMEAITGRRAGSDEERAGEPVWFGCDVGQQHEGKRGLWDARLFDYDALYGGASDLPKAERLALHGTAMTHAMLLTGVDVVDGPGGEPAPRRWRVENSWGTDKGTDGFWTMNDSWFAEHVFEIAVRRDALPADLTAALEEEPIVLPAWDPMGALAY